MSSKAIANPFMVSINKLCGKTLWQTLNTLFIYWLLCRQTLQTWALSMEKIDKNDSFDFHELFHVHLFHVFTLDTHR